MFACKKHYIILLKLFRKYNHEPLILPLCAASKDGHYETDKTLCSLKTFLAIADEMIPVDYKNECRALTVEEDPDNLKARLM